jgi:hypothetical protein
LGVCVCVYIYIPKSREARVCVQVILLPKNLVRLLSSTLSNLEIRNAKGIADGPCSRTASHIENQSVQL